MGVTKCPPEAVRIFQNNHLTIRERPGGHGGDQMSLLALATPFPSFDS